jgi:hypothetical protein
MHRPPGIVIAVFALLLASAPLWAQRGGGHGSAGGHGGGFAAHSSSGGGHSFGGGRMGGGTAFGGTRSFSGAHSGGHSRGFAPRSFSRGSSLHASPSSRGRNHSGVGVRIRTRGFRNNCYGYGCSWWGYPYLGGGIDPYWWWDHDSSSDQQYAGAANDPGPYDQRGEQGDQDSYARSAPPRAPEAPSAGPDTVLVFRDQHKQEVQNYAIVGQTLWIFAPQRTQKVALTDLDLDATHKANDDRGVDFRVPRAGEGQ